ncbi:helix-turn-helix domain-containing protein [Echinicola marina]|uniref:helix-turn-helix domain-containing protein n=1 Tax=Echinicola marina TaxID=2859768 RepID=UPI001CF65F03|nr:helix-turn-helix domain-containing protein [Echinicola marina]UCS94785.1 helix-turn-helix domain-containing protein [Echinicola marina]
MNKTDGKMQNLTLGQRVKNLRSAACLSQEELAEISQISLRTVQRLEIGATTPRGDTLKRLAAALKVTTDDLLEWRTEEDRGFLKLMNLGSLGFLFFPILGIVIPLVLWIKKMDTVQFAKEIGKSILNFQITWCVFYYGIKLLMWLTTIVYYRSTDVISINFYEALYYYRIIFLFSFYGYNLLIILWNARLIHLRNKVWYKPVIRFLK